MRHIPGLFFLLGLAFSACADESTDYVAEHILESPMNARYLATSATNAGNTDDALSTQIGYASFDAQQLGVRVAMLDFNWKLNDTNENQWSVSAFYDLLDLTGRDAPALIQPSFADVSPLPASFNANISNVGGHAKHFGIGLFYTWRRPASADWQVGIIIESLRVSEFSMDFDSTDTTPAINGELDYAANYTAFTPIIAANMQPDALFGGQYSGHGRLVGALPLPRVGFEGSLQSGSAQASGSTETAGNGTHIPDPFIGFSYVITHRASGISTDIGASLFTALFEPAIHKGISRPVYINLRIPLR